MKSVSKKYILLSILDKAFGLAPRSGPNISLRQVKLVCENDSLTAIGSDGELSIISTTPQVDIQEDGEVLLPTRVHDIVKVCPDDDVILTVTDSHIEIDAGGAHWSVVLDQTEYPEIDETSNEETEVSKDVFLKSLVRCRPAVDSDAIRASYAFVQIKNGYMRATDGNKFHQILFPYDIDLLLPSRAVGEIIKLSRSMALEDIKIGQNDRCYIMRFDYDTLIISKHNVEYPDVETVMLNPALENDQRISVDLKGLSNAVKRVSLMADEDTKFITLALANGELTLSTADKYGNQAYEKMNVFWESPDRKLGMNHDHLADVLSAISGGDVTIHVGEDKGARLSSLCFLNDDFTAVLMQLRMDIGEATKGSDRVRAGQQEPSGWGEHGLNASDATIGNSRRTNPSTDPEIDIEEFETADLLEAE
jgi:DNA polymerase III sliding clamp (beta) subunit (PCNA family)